MDKLNFIMRTNLKFGEGELKNLPQYLGEFGFKRVGVIIDPAAAKNPYIMEILDDCRQELEKVEVIVYSIKGEPTYDYLDEVANVFRQHLDLQVIIGIGGGSSMDLAKGIALLMTNPGKGLEYRGFPTEIKDPLPVVSIPTTAGTGSETTFNAVFTDTAGQKKLGINSTKNFPCLAILDPCLIRTCPPEVIASSGMDAVVHAVESFVSRKANFITRMFSINAYHLLSESLKRVVKEPENLEILGNLQLGAYLAIIALANSSSGPAGGLSYLLGTWYKVPHGIAGAFFLHGVQKFNFDHGYLDFAGLYDSKDRDKKWLKKDGAKFIIDELFKLNELLGIPKRISDFGVPGEDYERFVNGCLHELKGAFELNPVPLTEENIRELLKGYFI